MSHTYHLTSGDEPEAVSIERLAEDDQTAHLAITRGDDSVQCWASRKGNHLHLQVGSRSVDCAIRKVKDGYEVTLNGRTVVVGVLSDTELRRRRVAGGGIADDASTIASPMAGRVVKVLVGAGDEVEEGQSLLIIEAMKMENEIKAGRPGTLSGVDVAEADTVEVGTVLVRFAEDD